MKEPKIDHAAEAADEICDMCHLSGYKDILPVIRAAIEKEKQADLDLAIQHEAAQPPSKATSCGDLRPDPRVEKALQDYDDGKALDSLPRPGTPTKEPQICDECSRKLEDGALYEDHTPRPLPFPARIGTLEEMEGDRGLQAEFQQLREQLAAAVDAWHPASQPPTPEDFDPTGHIMLRFSHGDGSDPYVSYHACRENQYRNIEAGKQPVTHWRRITPPKP